MKLPLWLSFGALSLVPTSPASAQESKAIFDSAVVTLGEFDAPYKLSLDFDGDGDVDVLGMSKIQDDSHAKAAHTLTLYANQGDGRLIEVWKESRLDPVDKTEPAFVAGGNLLGDAREEFVYTWGHQVRIYQWDPALGQAVLLRTNVNAGSALDATAADFDGDGHENVAILLSDRVQVHVIQPNGTVHLVDVPIAAGRWDRVLPIDTDGDGASELLLVGMKGFELRAFPRTAHQNVRPQGARVAIHMPMPAVGDIDGDGDQDAVLFDMMGYQVLRNEHGVLRVEDEVMGGPATNLADVDQDGDLDGVCCSGGESPPYPQPNTFVSAFEISINDGTGRFAPAFPIDAIGSKGIAAVTDLDGDGDVELVAGRVIYYEHGPLTPPPANLAPAKPKEFRVVDADEDGDPDPGFMPDSLEENLGDGTTRHTQPRLPVLPSPQRYEGPGIPGDFDADGDCDLLADKWSGDTYLGVYLLSNTGGMVFEERAFAFQPPYPLSHFSFTTAETVLVQDVDQDGLADLITPSDYAAQIRWNDGPLGFSSTNLPTERVAAAADFDGDGIEDLVLSGHYVGTTIGMRKGLGGRAFGPYQVLYNSAGDTGFGAGLDRLAVADLNGDGALDIAFVDRNSGNVVLLEGTTGSLTFTLRYNAFSPRPAWFDFPDEINYGSGNRGERVYAVDLDGDGTSEVIVTPVGSRFWPDDDTAAIGKRTGSTWSWSRQMLDPRAFVDADGDGDPDAICARVVLDRTIEGPASGQRVQFGTGFAGLGALTPKLGASGPFRVGETLTLRISGGRGGASGTLVEGRTRADLLIGGVPLYVDPGDAHYLATPFVLDGASGAPGAGHATISFVVPAAMLGVTNFYQVFVNDPGAAGGTSASNGLELQFGSLP